MTELSVIIPVFNEERTIKEIISSVKENVRVDYEMIVVDDGSTDATFSNAQQTLSKKDILLRHKENMGKSSALRTALQIATGDWVIVQDADLEYNPAEIQGLLRIAKKGKSNPVYGRRPANWCTPRRWFFAVGVLLVDVVILFLYGQWVRDHATCYKLLRRETYEMLKLESSGFEGCVEITAKLMRIGITINQVPIGYSPRGFSQGKKLTAMHGLNALKCAWKYRNWTC